MTEQEFNELFRAHLAEISSFISRRAPVSDVEDLAADLFALAWQKRKSIPTGFELPWLYKTARFLISNHNRKQAGRRAILATFQEPVAAPSAESVAMADLELSQAWQRLTAKDREILGLWAFEGLDSKSLAVVIEKSENAAAIALSRAKSKLMSYLENENL